MGTSWSLTPLAKRIDKHIGKMAPIVGRIVLFVFLLFVIDMCRNGIQQGHFTPRSRDEFRVTDVHYSSRGIALDLHAPAGVAEVWRRKPAGGVGGALQTSDMGTALP